MAAPTCVQHPQAPALYRCEACGSALCGECIKLGHALILCGRCGERALPLAAATAATPAALRRQQAVAKPYGLRDALLYPFRAAGLHLFLAALVSMVFVDFVASYGFGFVALRLALWCGLWTLLIGIQFKIVRSTVEGDNELPDWPEYFGWRERLPDVLTYIAIAALQVGPWMLLVLGGRGSLFARQANLLTWAGFSIAAWAGTALGVMAWGAAGTFDRSAAIRVDRHVRALAAVGPESIMVVNLVFGLSVVILLLRALFAAVPLVGAAASGVVGAYWLFTEPHLAGVLFRRHLPTLEAIY